MIIVWSQICKQAVANLLHLSGKYGGVKATRTLRSQGSHYRAMIVRWILSNHGGELHDYPPCSSYDVGLVLYFEA